MTSLCLVVVVGVILGLNCWMGVSEGVEESGGLNNKTYKPVVIIHGIFDKKRSLLHLKEMIQTTHPGTEVILADKLHGWRSVAPLWYQVKVFRKILEPLMDSHPQGIHLIGYSQGGLVARGLVQTMDNHNVDTLVSLSSPQGGQFGDNFLRIFFPTYMAKTAWRIFYRKTGQKMSVGNYWRDPNHMELYMNRSVFLPILDNSVMTSESGRFKNNFERLRRLVLIGGPDDGVICPWESSQFGVFGETGQVIPMEKRDEFLNNSFGLKTLSDLNKLDKLTVPGVSHLNWHRNDSFIQTFLIPLLT